MAIEDNLFEKLEKELDGTQAINLESIVVAPEKVEVIYCSAGQSGRREEPICSPRRSR